MDPGSSPGRRWVVGCFGTKPDRELPNCIMPTSIKRSRHYAVFNPKRHVGLSPVVMPNFPPIVVPDFILNRRAGLDPASAAGCVLLTWIPGQARDDGGEYRVGLEPKRVVV